MLENPSVDNFPISNLRGPLCRNFVLQRPSISKISALRHVATVVKFLAGYRTHKSIHWILVKWGFGKSSFHWASRERKSHLVIRTPYSDAAACAHCYSVVEQNLFWSLPKSCLLRKYLYSESNEVLKCCNISKWMKWQKMKI